jgi:hypothetical protein
MDARARRALSWGFAPRLGPIMHVLTEHPLPGLDPHRLQTLADAGLRSLEELVAADPRDLAARTGLDLKTCRALVRLAGAALRGHDDGVIELVTARDEPGSVRLTRGLGAARGVESAVSLVRKARAHAGKRPPKERWARTHARARRQLRRLLDALGELQQAVLSDGLSEAGLDHLIAVLEAFDQELQPLLAEPLRKRALRSIARAARRTRLALANP